MLVATMLIVSADRSLYHKPSLCPRRPGGRSAGCGFAAARCSAEAGGAAGTAAGRRDAIGFWAQCWKKDGVAALGVWFPCVAWHGQWCHNSVVHQRFLPILHDVLEA